MRSSSFIKFIFVGIFFFTAGCLLSQDKTKSKHSIHGELAGRTILFASINYEYKVSQRFSLGTGLGVASIGKSTITRDNSNTSETGDLFELSSSQMLYANYFLGEGKHKVLFTGGVTNFLLTEWRKYPSETEFISESNLRINGGIGYQFEKNKTYFRFTAYLVSISESTVFFPKYFPWAGISFGRKL